MVFVALLSLCACVFALLLAVRIVWRPSDNPPAAWSLAVYLVSVSAFVADQIAYSQDWFALLPHAFGVANPFIVAIFPSLFLYVRGVTHPTTRWSRWSLAHFAPPIVAFLSELPTYFLSAEEKLAAARAQVTRSHASGDELFVLLLLNLYAITYLVLSWRTVHAGCQRLRESAEEGRAQSFRGLEVFVILITVLTSVSAILDFTPWQFSGSLAVALAAVVGGFTAFWLLADHEPLLKARAPTRDALVLATPPSGDPAPIAEFHPASSPPPSSPISDTAAPPEPGAIAAAPVALVTTEPARTLRPAEIERLQRRFDKLLGHEKIYLDADLSLQTLADRAETTRHKTSAAIREIYGLTFYQLIARHRVHEAATRLRTKAGANRNISDIAFSVGFNTLSAFNTAFKAEFGLTPSKFRENPALVPETAINPKSAPSNVLDKQV